MHLILIFFFFLHLHTFPSCKYINRKKFKTLVLIWHVFTGRIYDLGGQVLAANSAPTIFHLAKEIGAETDELDTHKFATIDSSTGKYNDSKVVDDYVSMISLTLKLQVSFFISITTNMAKNRNQRQQHQDLHGKLKSGKRSKARGIKYHYHQRVKNTIYVKSSHHPKKHRIHPN